MALTDAIHFVAERREPSGDTIEESRKTGGLTKQTGRGKRVVAGPGRSQKWKGASRDECPARLLPSGLTPAEQQMAATIARKLAAQSRIGLLSNHVHVLLGAVRKHEQRIAGSAGASPERSPPKRRMKNRSWDACVATTWTLRPGQARRKRSEEPEGSRPAANKTNPHEAKVDGIGC